MPSALGDPFADIEDWIERVHERLDQAHRLPISRHAELGVELVYLLRRVRPAYPQYADDLDVLYRRVFIECLNVQPHNVERLMLASEGAP